MHKLRTLCSFRDVFHVLHACAMCILDVHVSVCSIWCTLARIHWFAWHNTMCFGLGHGARRTTSDFRGRVGGNVETGGQHGQLWLVAGWTISIFGSVWMRGSAHAVHRKSDRVNCIGECSSFCKSWWCWLLAAAVVWSLGFSQQPSTTLCIYICNCIVQREMRKYKEHGDEIVTCLALHGTRCYFVRLCMCIVW